MEKQTIRYRVTFECKPEYDGIWELELGESGAFKYGNGTCVLVTANGKHFDYLDTRYDVGIVQNFAEWCEKYMNMAFNKDYGPHFEKIME